MDTTPVNWPAAVAYSAFFIAMAASVWAVMWLYVQQYRDECDKRVRLTKIACKHPGTKITDVA